MIIVTQTLPRWNLNIPLVIFPISPLVTSSKKHRAGIWTERRKFYLFREIATKTILAGIRLYFQACAFDHLTIYNYFRVFRGVRIIWHRCNFEEYLFGPNPMKHLIPPNNIHSKNHHIRLGMCQPNETVGAQSTHITSKNTIHRPSMGSSDPNNRPIKP